MKARFRRHYLGSTTHHYLGHKSVASALASEPIRGVFVLPTVVYDPGGVGIEGCEVL
jgi:hypothetical protein